MDDAVIRAELERILKSPEMQGSERLCRFLRYVVEARLRGEQEQLKEFLIGKEVFDRNGDYDPRIDPIVRVEARRLRKKLDEFYSRDGAALRIELPKGGYAPEFVTAAPPAVAEIPPSPKRRRWLIPVVWILSLAEVGCVVYFYRAKHPQTPQQTIAVMPARWTWRGNDFPEIRHDEDLAERICEKLSHRQALRVIGWPVVQRYEKSDKNLSLVAKEVGATQTVIVAVRIESDGFRVTSYLLDSAINRKLNVTDMRGVPLDTPADRDKAATAVAAKILQAETK